MGMTGRALCYKLMFCRRRVQAVFMFSRMAPSHVIHAQSHTQYAQAYCFCLAACKVAVVSNCTSHSVGGLCVRACCYWYTVVLGGWWVVIRELFSFFFLVLLPGSVFILRVWSFGRAALRHFGQPPSFVTVRKNFLARCCLKFWLGPPMLHGNVAAIHPIQ